MKKMILPALCLSLILTTLNTSATTISNRVATVLTENDERTAIKSEELPAAVQKNLSSDVYKGWAVKEATKVSTKVAADAAKAPAAYYEVVLSNEKETKTVKFQEDGTLLN